MLTALFGPLTNIRFSKLDIFPPMLSKSAFSIVFSTSAKALLFSSCPGKKTKQNKTTKSLHVILVAFTIWCSLLGNHAYFSFKIFQDVAIQHSLCLSCLSHHGLILKNYTSFLTALRGVLPPSNPFSTQQIHLLKRTLHLHTENCTYYGFVVNFHNLITSMYAAPRAEIGMWLATPHIHLQTLIPQGWPLSKSTG